MRHHKRVEYLAIGDELLLGLRLNGHLAYLGAQLASHGLPLSQATEVPDRLEAIRDSFKAAWERADLIITTGGLGPTCDDVTKEVIADTLGLGLRHDPGVEADLLRFFAARGREPSANNFRQCGLIEGAVALRNPNGTAPGQWLELDGKLLILLPGPAGEMIPLLCEQVLPRLRDLGWAVENEGYLQFRTIGLGESQLASALEGVLQPWEQSLQPAFCAHGGVVDVRLQWLRDPLEAVHTEEILCCCQQVLGDAFLGLGEPDPASMILQWLRREERTFAVAESCTGGLLAHQFTNFCGASKVFMGGMVCYRNEAKEQLLGIPGCLLEQHGAVSPECAAAMASAVAEIMESDYGLSITGYAGPSGGNEPAGTVYIGYHSPFGVWSRKEVFPGNRMEVKERSVNAALNFFRLQLLRETRRDSLAQLQA